MCGHVSANADEQARGRGLEGGLLGDRETLRDLVSEDRRGPGPRAFSGAVGADVQSDPNRIDAQEPDGAGGVTPIHET